MGDLIFREVCWLSNQFYIQRSSLVINHFFLYFQRNTLWSPDQCSICTCEDPVVMCEDVRCSSPNCDTKKVIIKKRLLFYFFFSKNVMAIFINHLL